MQYLTVGCEVIADEEQSGPPSPTTAPRRDSIDEIRPQRSLAQVFEYAGVDQYRGKQRWSQPRTTN